MTVSAKLRFLAEAVLAGAEHPQITEGRLFAVPMAAAPLGPAIDNLNSAERLGWIRAAKTWVEVPRSNNRMNPQ